MRLGQRAAFLEVCSTAPLMCNCVSFLLLAGSLASAVAVEGAWLQRSVATPPYRGSPSNAHHRSTNWLASVEVGPGGTNPGAAGRPGAL